MKTIKEVKTNLKIRMRYIYFGETFTYYLIGCIYFCERKFILFTEMPCKYIPLLSMYVVIQII